MIIYLGKNKFLLEMIKMILASISKGFYSMDIGADLFYQLEDLSAEYLVIENQFLDIELIEKLLVYQSQKKIQIHIIGKESDPLPPSFNLLSTPISPNQIKDFLSR